MEKKTRFPSPTLKASVPWNAGKMVGAKRALKEKHVWAIGFGWGANSVSETELCLILLSIANSEAAILSAFVSAMSLPAVRCATEPWSSNRKPGDLYNSKLQKQRGKACGRGWSIEVVA